MLMIKVEISGGEEISSVCKEAHALSKQLQCGVIFDFNGIEVEVFPLSDPGVIAQSWWETHCGIDSGKTPSNKTKGK